MKKRIKLIVLILWMALIFYLSSQVANDSTTTTNIVVEIIYNLYKTIFKNPLSINAFTNIFFTPIRKLAHFSEFLILGILAYLYISECKIKNNYLWSMLLSFLYAISDEIHQIFVPGRYCAITDILIDTFGAFIGILFIHLIINKWKKH